MVVPWVGHSPARASAAIDAPADENGGPALSSPSGKASPEKAAGDADACDAESEPDAEGIDDPACLSRPEPCFRIPAFEGDVDEETPLFEGRARLDAENLSRKLSLALSRPEMKDVRVGLHVLDLESGGVFIEHNAKQRFNPASNQKLLTTAAALAKLGPDFRFETKFYGMQAIDTEGTLKGGLWIVGGGDPWLVVQQVYKLALGLYAAGLRRIEGNIYVDDGFFDSVREGPGWEQDDTDNAYQAPMGALSANFNAVSVYILPSEPGKPARVTTIPETRYLKLENTAVTSEGRRTRIITHTPPEKDFNKVTVEGRIHPKAQRRVYHHKIDNPPLYAGWLIHDIMKQVGIRTTGFVKMGEHPETSEEIYTFRSPPLTRLIGYINKYSNNHMAEQTVKTLGAVLKDEGSWEAGLSVIREFIETEIGVPAASYEIKNGSGLGDVNAISPELLTRVLRAMHLRPDIAVDYIASLSVAGRDGTLRTSFESDNVTGLFRAKTGTLEEVMSLSGYLVTGAGRRLAVSLIFNQCKGHDRRRLKDIQHEIIRLLAAYDPDSNGVETLPVNLPDSPEVSTEAPAEAASAESKETPGPASPTSPENASPPKENAPETAPPARENTRPAEPPKEKSP